MVYHGHVYTLDSFTESVVSLKHRTGAVLQKLWDYKMKSGCLEQLLLIALTLLLSGLTGKTLYISTIINSYYLGVSITADSPCLAMDVIYNRQQEQYCLIPDPSVTWPHGMSVAVSCRLSITSTVSKFKLCVLYNGTEILQNSSKYIIQRTSLTITSARRVYQVGVNILNFTRSDTGNYTCRADFSLRRTLQNTTEVTINSSRTPCALNQQLQLQRPSPSSRSRGSRISIVVDILTLPSASSTPNPVSTASEGVRTGTPTKTTALSTLQSSSVESKSPRDIPSSHSVSFTPNPAPTQLLTSAGVGAGIPSETTSLSTLQSSSKPQLQVTTILLRHKGHKREGAERSKSSNSQQHYKKFVSQPAATTGVPSSCVLGNENSAKWRRDNVFIAVSASLSVLMAVGILVFSAVLIYTRRRTGMVLPC